MNPEWICEIPRLVPMEMSLEEKSIGSPGEEAYRQTLSVMDQVQRIGPGSRVAITIGSRGIACIREIAKGVVDAVKKHGGQPFIVPAMGSHGGEDSNEKALILSHLGITEASLNAPVSGTAEIVFAGNDCNGIPVYCQKEAFSADAIILLNRIKPHTDFRGPIESGLVKMACVGLGGAQAASWVHRLGYDHLAERVRAAGEAAIRTLKIRMGLAVVEGRSARPISIKAFHRDEIVSGEQELLNYARATAARLPVGSLDILVAMEMGKDVSGLGLDPLITGRYPSGKVPAGDDVPHIYRIVVLDLTDSSEGNSAGVGLCDVTTRRLFIKTDLKAVYRNVIVSKGSASARMPMVMDTDREAICVGLLTCTCEPAEARMIVIRNTLHIRRFLASEALAAECEKAGAKVVGEPVELSFDESGSLKWPGWLAS